MATQSYSFEQLIEAPTSQVYHAFTNATALRGWLCDVATVDPKPGGRIYLAWYAGFYACGEYTRLVEDQEVAFTWFGRDEPERTQVKVTISAKGDGTLVNLSHEGAGSGGEWASTTQAIKQGWQNSLENLASVLGSGEDLRLTQRPMLGITLNDFTPEQARRLGAPLSKGVRIDDAVQGMGAQAAGLRKDDVIVEMGGCEIQGFQDLPKALQGKRAGERVEVVYYRGIQKATTNMGLSRRPIPEISPTIEALENVLKQRYSDLEIEIDEFFEGVSEAQANFKASPEA